MHWNAQIYWEINQIYQETTNHEEEEKLDWETNFSKSAKLQLTFLQFRSGHKTQAAEKMSLRDSCGSQFFATDIKTQVEMFMCQQTLWPDIYLAVGIKVTQVRWMVDDKETKGGCSRSQLFKANAFLPSRSLWSSCLERKGQKNS